MSPSGARYLTAYSSRPGGPPWGLFLNPQSKNSSPLFPGCAGTSMLGFDAPQLFSLPPWAKAGIAMANIIAAMTKATTTSVMMRLIKSTPSSPKGGTHHARYGTQRGKHDAKQGQAQLPYGLFSYAKWLFFWGELPRIPIPRTPVNKRKGRAGAALSPGSLTSLALEPSLGASRLRARLVCDNLTRCNLGSVGQQGC